MTMAKGTPGPPTNDVRLRDVTEADLPIFFEHQLDPDANRMAAFPARDRDAFMAHWAKILRDETVTTKTILFDGRVAGNIVSWEQFGEQEVGYWIGKEYWGKGVATRTLAAFLGDVSARPLYARVAKHNIGSRRVLEKCGFTICGEEIVLADASGEQVEEYVLKLEANESNEALGGRR
jgi:RimJ/RimL family protein N-acetyltransferase